MNNYDPDDQLKTLSDSGRPPETRIATATQARQIYERMWQADVVRAKKRMLVKGLVDGNPPYRQADLTAAGRDNQANINFRIGESYFNNAVGAFYDLFSEAPTYATVKLKGPNKEQADQWSRIATTHFDWLCRFEPTFDYNMQISQDQMVLYGCGPLVFCDEFDWRPMAVECGRLKVPERAKSDTEYWELATVEVDYLADQLYGSIRHPKEAADIGWNVVRTREAIMRLHPDYQQGGLWRNWEWHQQQLKNGSLYYSTVSSNIRCVHLFFREFCKDNQKEGEITHLIIMADGTDQKDGDKFLFQKIGRFENWRQCVHPMYYDRGGGGFHHSVTGMGVKMYSAIEYQNRLLCNLADKAFSPKMVFKPTTSTQAEEFSLTQFGEYSVLSEGFDLIQTPIQGVMEEGVVFNRELGNMISSNLSQYRSQQKNKQGNPKTAYEVGMDAQHEASLQKTQMNRYYAQQDGLYGEMYRRATLKGSGEYGPGSARCKEFIKRCKADGVSHEALREVECVKASRVVGQGSEFLRKQTLNEIWITVGPGLPENGRTRLVNDIIAAGAGQAAVERYNPQADASTLPDDQVALAMGQVADMKIGVPAVVTASQNPAIFAPIFLQAADQAAGSLEQGADPKDVARFLDLSGQAIAQHIQRLSRDPSRKQLVEELTEKWQQLANLQDKLIDTISAQGEEEQQRQADMEQQQQTMLSELALKKQRQDAELVMKNEKNRFGMAEKGLKARQSMAIKDATAAQNIRLKQQANGEPNNR